MSRCSDRSKSPVSVSNTSCRSVPERWDPRAYEESYHCEMPDLSLPNHEDHEDRFPETQENVYEDEPPVSDPSPSTRPTINRGRPSISTITGDVVINPHHGSTCTFIFQSPFRADEHLQDHDVSAIPSPPQVHLRNPSPDQIDASSVDESQGSHSYEGAASPVPHSDVVSQTSQPSRDGELFDGVQLIRSVSPLTFDHLDRAGISIRQYHVFLLLRAEARAEAEANARYRQRHHAPTVESDHSSERSNNPCPPQVNGYGPRRFNQRMNRQQPNQLCAGGFCNMSKPGQQPQKPSQPSQPSQGGTHGFSIQQQGGPSFPNQSHPQFQNQQMPMRMPMPIPMQLPSYGWPQPAQPQFTAPPAYPEPEIPYPPPPTRQSHSGWYSPCGERTPPRPPTPEGWPRTGFNGRGDDGREDSFAASRIPRPPTPAGYPRTGYNGRGDDGREDTFVASRIPRPPTPEGYPYRRCMIRTGGPVFEKKDVRRGGQIEKVAGGRGQNRRGHGHRNERDQRARGANEGRLKDDQTYGSNIIGGINDGERPIQFERHHQRKERRFRGESTHAQVGCCPANEQIFEAHQTSNNRERSGQHSREHQPEEQHSESRIRDQQSRHVHQHGHHSRTPIRQHHSRHRRQPHSPDGLQEEFNEYESTVNQLGDLPTRNLDRSQCREVLRRGRLQVRDPRGRILHQQILLPLPAPRDRSMSGDGPRPVPISWEPVPVIDCTCE